MRKKRKNGTPKAKSPLKVKQNLKINVPLKCYHPNESIVISFNLNNRRETRVYVWINVQKNKNSQVSFIEKYVIYNYFNITEYMELK